MTDPDRYCPKWDSNYNPANGAWTERKCGATTIAECAFRCWDRPEEHKMPCEECETEREYEQGRDDR